MSITVQKLVDDGVLAPLHEAFADTLRQLDRTSSSSVLLAAALVSEQLLRGHVCLDLRSVEQLSFASEGRDGEVARYADWPQLRDWLQQLERSPLVCVRAASDGAIGLDRPLVLDVARQRVYLARYWHYQQKLAQQIARRLAAAPLELDEAQLAADIADLFPNREQPSERDQCLAAANAVDQRFAVITGGPGTGKTTTVAKLLALRLKQARVATQPKVLKVLLMAPTGKAAQRLNESLRKATSKLQLDSDVRAQLQAVTAGTIHRVLGWTPLPPERGGPFKHNADRPLDADVVLVDEASMVDIGLMWHLSDALPSDAQLILMGDRDQLASVEAGGVLSDLCGEAGRTGTVLTPARAELLASRTGVEVVLGNPPLGLSQGLDGLCASPTSPAIPSSAKAVEPLGQAQGRPVRHFNASRLSNAVSVLSFSHRFAADSELGRIATAIRTGDADAVIAQLNASTSGQVVWLGQSAAETLPQVVEQAALRYAEYLDHLHRSTPSYRDVLTALARVRVLCAHREGSTGEIALNQRIAQRLAAAGKLKTRSGLNPGQAVIVTENDYQQRLFNGDVGVVVYSEHSSGLAIVFEDSEPADGYRTIPAPLAPTTRDCWAMTIHKSQGSEFGSVFVVLPEFDSPVLSRELLYTAVTRVKDEIDAETGNQRPGFLCLSASEAVLRAAITREIRRTSGVRDAINEAGNASHA